MQIKWKRPLIAIALITLLGQAPAFAARIIVGDQCTLARAIIAANTNTTAGGVCRQGRGTDNIVLPRNRPQVLTRVDNISYGPTGLPVIRSNIRIIGNGNVISRRARARFRIFAVARNGRLALVGLTIRNGFATRRGGGGIRSIGILISIDVQIKGNRSIGNGGGIWAQNVVVIIRNRFSRNQSVPINGGGIFYATGAEPLNSLQPVPALTITDTTFSGNIARDSGGGAMVDGEATITGSTFADNAAAQGGALLIDDAFSSVEMTNTTLTDNIAAQSGGGILLEDGSLLTLNNSTVSGNTAPQGAEILAQSGASVETDNANTIGFGANAGIVGFTLGPSDTIAAQPPPDPTPEELPPIAQLIQESPPAEELPPPTQSALPPPTQPALPPPTQLDPAPPPPENLPPPLE